MGAPYLALTKRLHEAGAEVTYSEVLLVSDTFDEREGTVFTPHREAAFERLHRHQGVILSICETIEAERARRRCE